MAPLCSLLARQHRKRECWDQYDPEHDQQQQGQEEEEEKGGKEEGGLVGRGAYGPEDSGWSKTDSFDAYALDSSHTAGGASGG